MSRRHWAPRLTVPAALAVLGFACCVAGVAAAAVPLEAQVKAAYLFKFPSYVDWPGAAFPRPEMPFTIGVAGDERVAAELRRISAGRTIGGRDVVVREVHEAAQADSVHLLFVGRGDPVRTEAEIGWVRARPCLVVTDGDRPPRGTMIHFVIDEGRLRFDIWQAAAADRGLTLSARLLAVAHQVVVRVP